MSLDPRLSNRRSSSISPQQTFETLRRIVADHGTISRKSHSSDAETSEIPLTKFTTQINNGKTRTSSSPRSHRHIWKLLLPLIIGICIGATLVIFLHETPKARQIFHPLHRQYSRHLSHYHSGITGEGREEMLPDDETDPGIRAEFEARILNETESVCGKMMVTHDQWYVLNHALHPEPVSEADARDASNRTGFPIRKFGEAVSFLRWWGNAYYHGALQVLPFVNVMAKRLKKDLHHLTYLSTIPRSQEAITSWLGFNRSLSVSWPPPAFYVEKLYHIDMIQNVNVGNLNMPCITSFRAQLWRQFAHPHHYNPDNQYIVLANRLGTRSITNFDSFVNHLRKQFPNEKFIRQYGDERMEDIRDVYMGAKAVIYPHGANSANIHLFAPPHRQFTSGFHIGNAAHRLYPCLIIEITWMEMNGNLWRNVAWELGQAGHEHHNIRINASQVLLPVQATKKPISNLDEFLQNSNFYLEKEHMDEITMKLKNYLKARSDNPDYIDPEPLEQ